MIAFDGTGHGLRPQDSARAISKLLALLLLALIGPTTWAQCTCGFADGAATLETINIDGDTADWAQVHADPDNNVCDGPSGGIADRDAPVQSTGRDVAHFAFTWDTNNTYLFTGRAGSVNNVQRFVYYADTDNDGLMETGEPVLGANWSGNNRNVSLYVFAYQALNPGGDAMVDAGGFADGYTLPGSFINVPQQNSPSRSGTWGSADGLRFEFAVSWAELGVAPGAAISFHVASANVYFNSSSFTSQIDDNLAGCGGGPGSTQFGAVSLVANENLRDRQGQVATAAHLLTNLSNGSDTFNLASVFSGDHAPALSIYVDLDSSGDVSVGDTLVTDTDGDGMVDSGVLAASQALPLVFAYQIGANNPYDPSGVAVISTTATSSTRSNVAATVTDTVEVELDVSLLVLKSVSTLSDPVNLAVNPKAIPTAVMLYTVVVSNQGGGGADADTVVVTDALPNDTDFFVGDVGGPGSGPISFIDGSPTSNLAYTFLGLGDPGDSVAFSNDGGASFSYTPTPDAAGFDSSVTHIRITPEGSMAGATAAGSPSFELRFRLRID